MTGAFPDGLHWTPPGKLATVVTYLEMTERPADLAPGAVEGVTVEEVASPDPAWHRALFRAVGAEWLWFGWLELDDAALVAALTHPDHTVLRIRRDGVDVGLAEIDRRTGTEAEIVYFGLVGSAVGRGLGRLLMQHAMQVAWGPPVRRVWLHTCHLDDPRAVGFYRRMGFRPYATAIEITDDPRLIGLLPHDCAPAVPFA